MLDTHRGIVVYGVLKVCIVLKCLGYIDTKAQAFSSEIRYKTVLSESMKASIHS